MGQGFLLNLGLTDQSKWASSSALDCRPMPLIHTLAFYMGARDLKSSLHACTASILLTDLTPESSDP